MVESEPGSIDFAFKQGEKCHPEKVIQRLFRVRGRHLNLPSEIPTDARRSVRELIELYQPQIEEEGENSLAQLCPPRRHFEVLTIKGIDLVHRQNFYIETRIIKTIDELRELFVTLDANQDLRVFVHRQSRREPRNRLDLSGMRKLIRDCDALSEEPSPQESQ